MFDNGNMPNLEKLNLAGADIMDRRDDDEPCVIKALARNCPRLKYIDLYKGK